MSAVLGLLVFLICLTIYKGAVIVPQQMRYVVERLGKFHATLDAGFHILIPYLDSVRYRHSLTEQVCITSDNVQVAVDGVVYVRVVDAKSASYGIDDFLFGIIQLAQTTLRSEIGKIELDKTFEARAHINSNVVTEVDKAAEAWGVKVLRYEIKNITPPREVITAMEKQMKAEREKRAAILASEGQRDSAINSAEGEKQRQIKESEASMMSQVNRAKGEAEAILEVARATAEGLRLVGESLKSERWSCASQSSIFLNLVASRRRAAPLCFQRISLISVGCSRWRRVFLNRIARRKRLHVRQQMAHLLPENSGRKILRDLHDS
jgi:regulator of protease activity HflC (stomatin/prohibitin superfamily)